MTRGGDSIEYQPALNLSRHSDSGLIGNIDGMRMNFVPNLGGFKAGIWFFHPYLSSSIPIHLTTTYIK